MQCVDIPKIIINNVTAICDIVPPFSLSSLSAAFPFSTHNALSRIVFPFYHTNLSIFHTGSVISRSSRSVSDIDDSFLWLSSFLAIFNLKLSSHYDILNIAGSTNIALPLNLSALSLYLPNCTYDPSPSLSCGGQHAVHCIVFHFRKVRPRSTALIFPSGNVILTGFESASELTFHTSKLLSLLSEITLNHPEVLAK